MHIHILGICGTFMGGIALLARAAGHRVTGCDANVYPPMSTQLGEQGVDLVEGYGADQIALNPDLFVIGNAISRGNPLLESILERNLPFVSGPQWLAENILRGRWVLGVAGTHGKTTTTSMLAMCLHKSGLDPTVVIGGRLDAFGANARLGKGDYLVAEADESDGSFLLLDPTVTVITNIDPEHLDHWKTFDALIDGFVAFANRVPFYGFNVLCTDHPVVQQILPRIRRKVISYGLNKQAEVRADRIVQDQRSLSFRVWRNDEALGELRLSQPGRHNVLNALAATAVSLGLDIPFEQVQAALEGFSGVDRRFSERAFVDDVLIIDDYGHHPVEIEATLQAASEGWENRRIVAVFQPHRPSRVRDLESDFCRAFNRAAHVVVCPIYAAGEPPIEGLDAARLAEGMEAFGHRSVVAVDGLDAALAHLVAFVRPGDLVVTLGAGDVNRLCGQLEDALKRRGSTP